MERWSATARSPAGTAWLLIALVLLAPAALLLSRLGAPPGAEVLFAALSTVTWIAVAVVVLLLAAPLFGSTPRVRAARLQALWPDAAVWTAVPYDLEGVWRRLVVFGHAVGDRPPGSSTLVVRTSGVALWSGSSGNPLRHLFVPAERVHSVGAAEFPLSEHSTARGLLWTFDVEGRLEQVLTAVYAPTDRGSARLNDEEMLRLQGEIATLLELQIEAAEPARTESGSPGLVLEFGPETIASLRDAAWRWDPYGIATLREQTRREYDQLIWAVLPLLLDETDDDIARHLTSHLLKGRGDGPGALSFVAEVRRIVGAASD